MKEERFMEILPVLRRTFSGFSSPERQKMLDLVKQDKKGATRKRKTKQVIDEERAQQVIPIVETILGLDR